MGSFLRKVSSLVQPRQTCHWRNAVHAAHGDVAYVGGPHEYTRVFQTLNPFQWGASPLRDSAIRPCQLDLLAGPDPAVPVI